MRIILFFDLPVITSKNQRDYRVFLKNIKKEGFYMLQESVYVKMVLDKQAADFAVIRVKKNLPPEGNVIILPITEKQFSSMIILLGEYQSDVVESIDRVISL